jgi:hypothetical protein
MKTRPVVPIQSLIETTKFLLEQIESHQDVATLDYQPDTSIADAKAALDELSHELEERKAMSNNETLER